MNKYLLSFFIFLTLGAQFCDADSSAVVQATLYTGEDFTGSSFLTRDYIVDVADFGFTNNAQSICLTGIWSLYQRDEYNDGAIGEYVILMGDNLCTVIPEPLKANVTSLRQVGSAMVPTRPSLTLYGYANFEGAEAFISKDWSDLGILRDQAYSAIVTGNETWTVYTYDNYGGTGTCLVPDQATTIGGDEVKYGFFPTYHELGSSGSIRSARIGCYP